jgi:ATP-dependent DNA helicase DinG
MTQEILKYFSRDGEISRVLPGFSPRPQQQTVAGVIEEAMAGRGGLAMIEAGTGVGKTLAYLIPTLRHARPDRKVVISTHTLALQGQLAEKDIPLVKTIWPKPFDADVIKGRGNYLCLMEYENAIGDLWTVGDPQYTEIGHWSRASETGDVAELPFTYPRWIEVQANSDTCKGQECRFYDRCFYYRMRRCAQEASILLVNHALFFADLTVRASGDPDAKLLPDYSFVVFDEAHHLESAAAAAFGVSFSSARLPGLMEKIRRNSHAFDLNFDRLERIETLNELLFQSYRELPRQEFFMKDARSGADDQADIAEIVDLIGFTLDGLATDLLKQDTAGQSSLKDRVDGLRRQCARAKEDLAALFLSNLDNYVHWGAHTSGRRGQTTTLHLTPISVAPLLHDALWKEPRAVGSVLISATLSTGGGFDYVRQRLGIPPAEMLLPAHRAVTETIVGSPFDYARHCLLYIPEHLPVPADDPIYIEQLLEEIIALVEAAGGGAFLLFTSHRALNIAYERLEQSDLPYPLLRQGEMPNARLVQAFKEEQNAVLFGTQSFWEGVDVPGMGLRLVVIDRIPFSVPDSPLHKARVESITAAGGDWFRDFAMPQAQLRLKQGFGRLIRTETDRGVVAILDTRLVRKQYGKEFLRFLPPARRASEIQEVYDFFAMEER